MPAALAVARRRRAGEVVVRAGRRLDQAAGRIDVGQHRHDRAGFGIEDVPGGRVDEAALVLPVEAGAFEHSGRVVEDRDAVGVDLHAPEAGFAGLVVVAVQARGAAAEVDHRAADAVGRDDRPLHAVLVDGHAGVPCRRGGEATGDGNDVRVARHHRQVVDQAGAMHRVRRTEREGRSDGAGRDVHAHGPGQAVERDVEILAGVRHHDATGSAADRNGHPDRAGGGVDFGDAAGGGDRRVQPAGERAEGEIIGRDRHGPDGLRSRTSDAGEHQRAGECQKCARKKRAPGARCGGTVSLSGFERGVLWP